MIAERITYPAIAIIIIISLALVYQYINPTFSEPYSELAVLGPNMKIGDYPKQVKVGDNFTLYLYVGNHEGHIMFYKVLVKLGNKQSIINSTHPMNATPIATYYFLLMNGKNETRKIILSMPYSGINIRLVFELWAYSVNTDTFVYKGIWNHLWLNVTQE